MSPAFEACPYCGRKIIKGAMKCMGCGKILKTAAEQQRSIERYKDSQKSSFFAKILKYIFFLLFFLVLGVVYKFYGVEIIHFVSDLIKK